MALPKGHPVSSWKTFPSRCRMECQGGICAISVPDNEIEAKKIPVSSTGTSAELGTTKVIYARMVVATVIPLTHSLPACLTNSENRSIT